MNISTHALSAVVAASIIFFQSAAVPGDEAKSANFEEHIKPIFRMHCLTCHGDDVAENDINLQHYAALLRGGSSGKIVEPGRSSQSLLFLAITNDDADVRMPPNSPPLSPEKIALIKSWIDAGLRETASGDSLVAKRNLSFEPSSDGTSQPNGPPAMPEDWALVNSPKVVRPLPVLATDASPWAPLVAVSGQDHIRLLRTDTEKEVGRLAFPEGEPHVLQFSRNGAVLMAAGGRPVESGRVVLFDVRSGKRVAEIGDEVDAVMAASLSPDQRLVALGGSGRVVKVYSTIDGLQKYKLTKHTDWITAITFSPDGKMLATGDRVGGIHLWDTATGRILLNLSEHHDTVHALDWRADGKLLASAGEDGKLIWWDVSDGFPAVVKEDAHPRRRPPGTYGDIPNGILSADFAPNGSLATTGRDQVVRVWSPDGSLVKLFEIDSGLPISCALSMGGTTVVTGDAAGQVRFWNDADLGQNFGKEKRPEKE